MFVNRLRTLQSFIITTTTALFMPYVLSQNVTNDACTVREQHRLVASIPTPTNDRLIPSYGADVSFPMHNAGVSTNYPDLPHNMYIANPIPPEFQGMPIQPLGDRQKVYDHYIEGCRKRYPGPACDDSEKARVEMSIRQPQSMVNYTTMGFKKIRAPKPLMDLLLDFWGKNENKTKAEGWSHGNSYVNHWENMSYMASVEDTKLDGGGQTLKRMIWHASEEIIQNWTKQKNLKTTSLYGIRVYKEGAILATHVDRLPLVSSAIINVDQDVDEPWPLEVIGHDGKAYNVTMEPGDMVLYESHSILHGRPFALKGRFFANIFIHFAPDNDVRAADGRPSYVIEGSPEHIRLNSEGETVPDSSGNGGTPGSTPAHIAAREGDLKALEAIGKVNKSWLFQKDINGWSPFFEATRSGEIEILKFLMYHGQDIYQANRGGQSSYELAKVFNQKVCEKFIRNERCLKTFGKIPRI